MAGKLAIQGGTPVRNVMLPYGHQSIDQVDVQAVVEVLRSDWLTTGPKVAEFEQAFANSVGTREAVAVSNGTAALQAAMFALGIEAGDEVIVPAITFVATANCVIYQGGTPVFADVDPDTLLLDPAQIEAKITSRTKAIIAVDYGGQPCDYDTLLSIAEHFRVALVADACHALGGAYKGRPVGSLTNLNAFSLHPVKPITSGEGGVVTTDVEGLAQRMRIFRNHGITTDHRQRAEQGDFFYEMVDLGYNHRLTDLQCALGLSQLRRLPGFVRRRREIAVRYDDAFSDEPAVIPLAVNADLFHAYHLYVVQLDLEQLRADRAQIFAAMRAENIGVNVHYIPVYLHPYYQQQQCMNGSCPVAESAYEQLLSLPIFPAMANEDVDFVIEAINKVLNVYRR